MTNLVNREEFKQCRDRVNPILDDKEFKASIARDTYTCTKTKQKRNAFDFKKEMDRINKEIYGYEQR